MKIILFEDSTTDAPLIAAAIRRHLSKGSKVEMFAPSSDPRMAKIPLYEERLAAEAQTAKYKGAALWVTDRDLSRTSSYHGLSEVIVSKVANSLGIPLCKYAQGTTDSVFERQRDWGDSQIVIDRSNFDDMGRHVVQLAIGFDTIKKKLKALLKKPSAERARTPAAAMAYLLDQPNDVDRLALYASGDQKMVAEILPYTKTPKGRKAFEERLPCLFGYWLYDSILRFPGILVNEIAAASYLNIAVAEFSKPAVRSLFSKAIYRGPFADETEPRWWRSNLDALVAASGLADGNSFAAKKLSRKVSRCLDQGQRAGWYCMVTKAPVSEVNSVGNISWFPPGADLARVRKDIFDQAGPWLGLY